LLSFIAFIESNHSSNGVFYTIEGTGEVWLIAVGGYDTRISLYEGTCDMLTCVASNDDQFLASVQLGSENFDPNSIIVQYLQEQTTYTLLVDGFDTMKGDFILFSLTGEPPVNDDCSNPEPIEIGTPIFAETLWALSDDSLPYCGE
jgi:hypothetical protein